LDRQQIEQNKLPNTNEIVMAEPNGFLTEGMTSNFFTIEKGIICTAPDSLVLNGTVRRALLQLCKERAIPIEMRMPNVNDAKEWEGCFITSTSRLVLPIDKLQIEVPSNDATNSNSEPLEILFHYAPTSIVKNIQRWVLDEMASASVPLE